MTTAAEAWDQITPDSSGSNSSEEQPPLGHHIWRLIEGKHFESKAGEQVVVLEFEDERTSKRFSDVRVFTKNGVPQEGRVKSLKIQLRNLGVPDGPLATLNANLSDKVGGYFAVEVSNGSQINHSTGEPFRNVNVTNAVSPPAGAPAPVQASESVPWDGPASNAGAVTGAPLANTPAPAAQGSW